jgi:multidrug resistance efflux pump
VDAVLGGVFLIGGLILLMNYNHPYSEISRQYFVTTPIVPNVNGQVIEVPVKGNQMLEKGDVNYNKFSNIRYLLSQARLVLAGMV